MHISLLDYRHQGLLRCPPGFEEAWQIAPLAQLGDLQCDPPRPGVPVPFPVSVALDLAQRRARALGSAGAQLHFHLHDPVGRKCQHLAHQIAVGLLLNQIEQRHSLVGHRHLRSWFQVLQPEPSPKIDGDRQPHHRPRAALRRGLRARPPTPTVGTRPGEASDQARRLVALTMSYCGGVRFAAARLVVDAADRARVGVRLGASSGCTTASRRPAMISIAGRLLG